MAKPAPTPAPTAAPATSPSATNASMRGGSTGGNITTKPTQKKLFAVVLSVLGVILIISAIVFIRFWLVGSSSAASAVTQPPPVVVAEAPLPTKEHPARIEVGNEWVVVPPYIPDGMHITCFTEKVEEEFDFKGSSSDSPVAATEGNKVMTDKPVRKALVRSRIAGMKFYVYYYVAK